MKPSNPKLAQENKQAAAARDEVLLPLLREMSDLSSRDAAEALTARGHPVNYKTQRMRQRHGLA